MEYLRSVLSEESRSNSIFEISVSQNCRERLWIVRHMTDYRIPPQCQWDLRSSAIMRSVDWKLGTDLSGRHIGPIFKGQAVQEERTSVRYLYFNLINGFVFLLQSEQWFCIFGLARSKRRKRENCIDSQFEKILIKSTKARWIMHVVRMARCERHTRF